MNKVICTLSKLQSEDFEFYRDILSEFNLKFVSLSMNESEAILIVECTEIEKIKEDIKLFTDTSEADMTFAQCLEYAIIIFSY